jgi:UDP-N-acetylglucosamine transferase subunit ALG13
MTGTLVASGNLPGRFPGLTAFLAANIGALPRPITVQTLADDVAAVARVSGCDVYSLFPAEEFRQRLSRAELVIGHCGVGLLNDCLNYGRPGNFLPRSAARGEHIDDHQQELARLIAERDLGRIISPASTARDLLASVRPRQAIRLDLTRHLPERGRFIVISSCGGHRSEAAPTARTLRDKGCDLLCAVVDEPIWPIDEQHQVVPSCATTLGLLRAIGALVRLMRHSRPDFIVTHGAGVGLAAVVSARLLGIPAFACESLTRINAPGRWFKGAVLAGARCFVPEHAHYAGHGWFRRVQPVAVEIFALEDEP